MTTIPMTAIREIEAALDEITDRDVERVERTLHKTQPGEKAIGTVHDAAARRMWAASLAFDRRWYEAGVKAKFDAGSEVEAETIISEAKHFESLAELCRDIFWASVKSDVGGWDAESKGHGGVGLRSGWMLAYTAKAAGHPLLKALGIFGSGPEPEE